MGGPRLALVLVLVTAPSACGQEGPATGPADPTLLRRLEITRDGDPAAWRSLLQGADDALLAGALRAMGRVGDARLVPVVRDVLAAREDAGGSVARAAALAVGLLGEPALLPPLAGIAGPADVALAAGLVGGLPEAPAEAARVLRALRAPGPASSSAAGLADPVEARFVYGARLAGDDLSEDALRVLEEGAGTGAERAAVYYFARHASAAKGAGGLRPLLRARLTADDVETAALAARALARCGGGDADRSRDASLVTAAVLDGGARIAQVSRLRALARLPSGPARPAILSALKAGDPHLRRSALETLAAVGGGLGRADRRGLATFAATVAQADPVTDVRRAALRAHAALDPEGFVRGLPLRRLAGPWALRAAAAVALGDEPWGGRRRLWARRFASDPDRRVVSGALQAALARAAGLDEEEDPSALLRLVARELSVAPAGDGRFRLELGRCSLHDPVHLGLAADLVRALLTSDRLRERWLAAADVGAFLKDVAGRVPSDEVEPLLAVAKLAAAVEGAVGAGVLQRLRRGAEIAVARLATEELRRRGALEAGAAPPARRPATWEAAAGDGLPERAVVRTLRGDVELRLLGGEAPVTVAGFCRLARAGFYDGVLFHRVVPAFVAQAGCPRGDGWGGPGYTLPCEVTGRTYRRGSVGMALAGRDTGGSQWFIAHRPLPHLDGRYTIFAEVSAGLDVVDGLLAGDRILEVEVGRPR